MEKGTKIGDEVIVLTVPWLEDYTYIGKIVKLRTLENGYEYATAFGDYDYVLVLKSYSIPTELIKALI